MALTKVQIISNALLQLGHSAISSLTGGDRMVQAAEAAYDMKLPSVLSSGNWRFATQIQQLSELTEAPPLPWKTAYSLPAGYLKTIRLWPNIYQWDIYTDFKIYTYLSGTLYMEYIFQPDVSQFPPYFVDYFTYEISAYLALSNAQKADYFSALEQKRMHMMAYANALDTQNRPQFSQTNIPVLNNRYVTQFIGNGGIAN